MVQQLFFATLRRPPLEVRVLVQRQALQEAPQAVQAHFHGALAEDRPFQEAVRWGAAAGALAVTKQGAQPSLPRRHEVLALMREA